MGKVANKPILRLGQPHGREETFFSGFFICFDFYFVSKGLKPFFIFEFINMRERPHGRLPYF